MERLRKSIDEVDVQILELLNRRVALSQEIGRVKEGRGWPVHDPERERGILARVRAESRGPLAAEALRRIYERILDESRRLARLARESQEPPGREKIR